jgi:hypothetical protein
MVAGQYDLKIHHIYGVANNFPLHKPQLCLTCTVLMHGNNDTSKLRTYMASIGIHRKWRHWDAHHRWIATTDVALGSLLYHIG